MILTVQGPVLSPKRAAKGLGAAKTSKPSLPKKPSGLSPTHTPAQELAQTTPTESEEEWKAEDDQVRKKVLELQKRKAELQKHREKNKVCDVHGVM